MPVYEDNASRWEQNPDGSYSRLPKQKQPPTSLGAVKEAIAANAGEIDTLKQTVPVMFATNGSQSIPSNLSNNPVTNLIGANVNINTANWDYADPDTFKVGTSGLYLVSITFGFNSGGGTVRAFSAGCPDISAGIGNVGIATGNPSDGNTSGFGYGQGSSRVVRLEKDWTVFLRARQNSGSDNALSWHFSAILLEADEQVQPTQIATRAEATPTTPVEYDLAALSRTSEIGPFTGTNVIPMEYAYGKTQYADAGAGTITIWEDGVYKVDAHYTNVGTGGVPAGSRSVLSVPGVCRDVQATPTTQTSEVNLNATNTMYLTAGTVLNITAHFANATSVTRGSLVVQRLDTARVVTTTPHACLLQGSGTQSITSGVPRNRVTFWQAEHDPSGMYQGGDAVNILADGLYQVEAMISFAGSDTGFRAVGVTLNGTTEAWEANMGAPSVPPSRMNFGLSKVFSLSKGDTVGVWAYQNTGSNIDIHGANPPHYSWFSVVRVGGDPPPPTAVSRVERRTGQFLVSHAQYPTIVINDTIHSVGGISRPGGGVLVVPKDGLYLMIARISFPHDTGGNIRLCYLRINGTSIAQDRAVPNTGYTTTTEVTATRFLNAGDEVSMVAYQNSGNDLDVSAAQDQTTLSVTLLNEGTA